MEFWLIFLNDCKIIQFGWLWKINFSHGFINKFGLITHKLTQLPFEFHYRILYWVKSNIKAYFRGAKLRPHNWIRWSHNWTESRKNVWKIVNQLFCATLSHSKFDTAALFSNRTLCLDHDHSMANNISKKKYSKT